MSDAGSYVRRQIVEVDDRDAQLDDVIGELRLAPTGAEVGTRKDERQQLDRHRIFYLSS